MTGAKRRAVQIWADAGAIRSTEATDRAGTGIHRCFNEKEVQITAILAHVSELQISIGTLRKIAGEIRDKLDSIVIAMQKWESGKGIQFLALYQREGAIVYLDLGRIPFILEDDTITPVSPFSPALPC